MTDGTYAKGWTCLSAGKMEPESLTLHAQRSGTRLTDPKNASLYTDVSLAGDMQMQKQPNAAHCGERTPKAENPLTIMV